jgi:hypothetical protein
MIYRPTKEEFLKEVNGLINTPNFFSALYHKVEELKELLNNDIQDHRAILELAAPAPTAAVTVETIDFELNRQGKEWCPSISGIPGEIIEYITENAGIGIVPMPRPFYIDGQKYKVFFEMQDNQTITGTLEKEIQKIGKKNSPAGTEPGFNHDELREFLECMLFYPDLYNTVMAQFRLKWKPAIENKWFNEE